MGGRVALRDQRKLGMVAGARAREPTHVDFPLRREALGARVGRAFRHRQRHVGGSDRGDLGHSRARTSALRAQSRLGRLGLPGQESRKHLESGFSPRGQLVSAALADGNRGGRHVVRGQRCRTAMGRWSVASRELSTSHRPTHAGWGVVRESPIHGPVRLTVAPRHSSSRREAEALSDRSEAARCGTGQATRLSSQERSSQSLPGPRWVPSQLRRHPTRRPLPLRVTVASAVFGLTLSVSESSSPR